MEKPSDCYMCHLAKISRGFSKSEGKARLGVAFFGESLGGHEYQEGLPFRPNGESGSLLTSITTNQLRNPVNGEKIDRSFFVWDNAIKCQPPEGMKFEGGEFEKDIREYCSQYNSRSIDSPDVKVIVAFGGLAFRSLTGIEGKKRGIADVRGYVFERNNGSGQLVVPSYHPAFVRRGNARLTGALIHDIKKSLLVASRGSNRGNDSSHVFVKEGKLEAIVSLYYWFRDNPQAPIYYDIETPWSKDVDEDEKAEAEEEGEEVAKDKYDPKEIRTIQFAKGKFWAIDVPWEKPFIKVAIAILGLGNPKLGFNSWHFDNPRLEANGVKIRGVVHDVMWAWHHMQPGLDKGLQKVASFFNFPYIWKHLAQEADKEDEYGCSDVISLAYIWEGHEGQGLPDMMKRRGVWDSYLKFKVRYREVLAATEKRGMPVDEAERKGLEVWLQKKLGEEDRILQDGVPKELRSLSPKRGNAREGWSYGYVNEPKDIRELRSFYAGAIERLRDRGVQSENVLSFERWVESRVGLSFGYFRGIADNGAEEFVGFERLETGDESVVGRWVKSRTV